MKRALRGIANLLGALSALLLACIVLLWARSYALFPHESVVWDRGPSWAGDARRTQWGIQSRDGALTVGRLTYSPKRRPTWDVSIFGGATCDQVRFFRSEAALDWIPRRDWWERGGFKWRHTIFSPFPTV